MGQKQKQTSASEKEKEDWMNSKWRPAMGWMYMGICVFDMVLFPILWSVLQTATHTAITQWNPLTLQGAGLFHIAMGAVLGIAAFGRTQEKMVGANNGGAGGTMSGASAMPVVAGHSAFVPTQSAAYTPGASWNSVAVTADPSQVISGFGGRAAPVIPPYPER